MATTTRTRREAPARGDMERARDILAAVRALKAIEAEGRAATRAERRELARFGGFGAVALRIFPDPTTGDYHSDGWRAIGGELRSLLTEAEYDSAKRTTFSQYFTSPLVMNFMFRGLNRLHVPANGLVLEPGCGVGNFMGLAPAAMRFVGVELDSISGRIARARFPQHDIRIEDFRRTRLEDGTCDAAIGNPPFADIPCDYRGSRLSLHDYFIARSLDALKPGGILALVTSHFTMDRRDDSARRLMGDRADFLAAVRLPSDAFQAEGTKVVADVLFFRRRADGQPARHGASSWLQVGQAWIDAVPIPINQYFIDNPRNVLGTWSRRDTLYSGEEAYSVVSDGDLAGHLESSMPAHHRYEGPVADDVATVAAPTSTPVTHAWAAKEGRFLIDTDGAIMQVEGGRPVPVEYGGRVLRADGGMTGKRLAALIGLRDLARAVLAAQNEGRPAADRDAARASLNAAYDAFVSAYGPINKTTLSGSADGSITRRMPNVVKFREDPDAMLVLALEEYDEETGEAARAPIMTRDVVGARPEVDRVETAEDGLIASLDRTGAVDLDYIARLYGRPADVVAAELGGLIYRDPESDRWEPADAYLSGDVRAKLRAAEVAGPYYSRNADALRAVQPEDVLPGDIDANLGAPWIPVADVRAFAAELFEVPAHSIRVGHLERDATWAVEWDHRTVNSVAARADFGTERVNGTVLFDQALNMRSPVVYDVTLEDGREVKTVNQEATLAAKEKQRAIKERFRAWAFADPDRADRLVRIYNDRYNNICPRLFDGAHLKFPGMNAAISLHKHQRDAIWRGMASGNMLMAHCVGAGKSFSMAAVAMKLRQAGIARKCLFAVPNHLLEQFAREFVHLYPDARLLIAGKDDLTRDRRKLLTAKIAGGDWDGIIVTHSGFERIGMSDEFQARFLREQIAEYEALLVEANRESRDGRGNRNIIKTIEKQKARREAKLEDLMAREKKDDGLVFDELGIDHIFIDESHYFKNLEAPTKMERVAGIQTGGSERAFDLYMKCRYLDEVHPGRGVVFATGTPISNTMVEMYTVQRFLDPEGLRSRGIEHFDGWAATFGEVVETMEISPDGASLRPRSRFAKFVNLPELVQLFRQVADVQTAAMLDLPCPALRGGKPDTASRPMSEGQAAMQTHLVKRYERIRSSKVDPREDNALAITTDGRKLALDGRLLGVEGDFGDSKINAMVANVARIRAETVAVRGTQMVFCDLGVHARPFSVYDDVVAKLIAAGVPAAEVAVMGDADTDAKKRALFERVRAGSARVLIGSTSKMGTGTNVQKRLIALHHLDAPWKPAEVEQRDGRILRQGNDNPEVAIFRYVTRGSFDAFMWQALETKARFIAQVMSGGAAVRRADDVGGQELSYAEVKAIASGNPAVMTLARADAELQRLAILRKNHADEQFLVRRNLRELPDRIAMLEGRIDRLAADLATTAAHAGPDYATAGVPVGPADEFAAVAGWMEGLPEKVKDVARFPFGTHRGLAVGMVIRAGGGNEIYLEGRATRRAPLYRDSAGPRAVLNAIARLAEGHEGDLYFARKDLEIARGQLEAYRTRSGGEFAHAARAVELAALRNRLRAGLGGNQEVDVAAVAARVEALIAGPAAGSSGPVARTVAAAAPAGEESVVTRILRGRAGAEGPAAVAPDTSAEAGPDDPDDVIPGIPSAPDPAPAAPRRRRGRRPPVEWGDDEPFCLRA